MKRMSELEREAFSECLEFHPLIILAPSGGEGDTSLANIWGPRGGDPKAAVCTGSTWTARDKRSRGRLPWRPRPGFRSRASGPPRDPGALDPQTFMKRTSAEQERVWGHAWLKGDAGSVTWPAGAAGEGLARAHVQRGNLSIEKGCRSHLIKKPQTNAPWCPAALTRFSEMHDPEFR